MNSAAVPNGNGVGLAVGALVLTGIVALAVLAFACGGQKDNSEPLLGVPVGVLVVSLLSVGLVAALTFTQALDMRVAGTLLGAHLGVHAGAAARRR